MSTIIRRAAADDSAAILEIYTPYVLNTAITFEITVPSAEDFSRRVASICGQYPYLVMENDGRVVAYAYASKHREREAYRYDADLSIYIRPDSQRCGFGRRLYGRLLALLRAQGYCNAYAAVTTPNPQSCGFHLDCGFKPVGTFHQTGYKFGRWHDVIWFEKNLADKSVPPPRLQTIAELPADLPECFPDSEENAVLL